MCTVEYIIIGSAIFEFIFRDPIKRRALYSLLSVWKNGLAFWFACPKTWLVNLTPEAEAPSNPIHPGSAERVGEVFLEDALPGYLHERGVGHEDRPHRIQSSGRKNKILITCSQSYNTFFFVFLYSLLSLSVYKI